MDIITSLVDGKQLVIELAVKDTGSKFRGTGSRAFGVGDIREVISAFVGKAVARDVENEELLFVSGTAAVYSRFIDSNIQKCNLFIAKIGESTKTKSKQEIDCIVVLCDGHMR